MMIFIPIRIYISLSFLGYGKFNEGNSSEYYTFLVRPNWKLYKRKAWMYRQRIWRELNGILEQRSIWKALDIYRVSLLRQLKDEAF